MENLAYWIQTGGRDGSLQSRLSLSEDDWSSRIIALATEGYDLVRIENILTAGRHEDQSLRDKWELGSGKYATWNQATHDQACDILWEFARHTIESLYLGTAESTPMSIRGLVLKIKEDYGIMYRESSVQRHLKLWGIPIRDTVCVSAPIYQASRDCVNSFQNCLKVTELGEFEDQLGRFKLWTSNIEVFSSSRSSLDNRLRPNHKTRNMVLQLLRTLQMNLDYAASKFSSDAEEHLESSPSSSRSGSPSTNSSDSRNSEILKTRDGFPPRILEVLLEVNSTISSLQRMSMAIRHASKQARDVKIAQHQFEDPNDIEIQNNLRSHAIWKVQFKFPNADHAVCRNLVESIVLRQKRFLYRRNKQVHSEPQILEMEAELPTFAPATTISSVPNTTSAPRVLGSVMAPSEMGKSIATSHNTAKVFDERVHDIEAIAAPRKIVDSVRSVRQDDSLDYPPPPQMPIGSTEIECPYCFDFLTKAELSSPKFWKSHVKMDLEPYSCYFDSCQRPTRTFGIFEDWLDHMSNHHAPRLWLCTVKAHSSMRFYDETAFRSHMESAHGDSIGVSQLDLLVKINSKPLLRPLSVCPFCGGFPDDCPTPERQDDAGFPDQLPRHVAGHLKEFALLALPARGDNLNSEKADTVGSDNDSRVDSLDEAVFEDVHPPRKSIGEFNDDFKKAIYDRIFRLSDYEEESLKKLPLYFTERGEYKDPVHRLKTDIPDMNPSLEALIELWRYTSQTEQYASHSFLSASLAASHLHKIPSSQGLMEPSWLEYDWQTADSTRDEEWGFSKITGYPPYIGQLRDPVLKSLIEAARSPLELYESKLAECRRTAADGREFFLIHTLMAWLKSETTIHLPSDTVFDKADGARGKQLAARVALAEAIRTNDRSILDIRLSPTTKPPGFFDRLKSEVQSPVDRMKDYEYYTTYAEILLFSIYEPAFYPVLPITVNEVLAGDGNFLLIFCILLQLGLRNHIHHFWNVGMRNLDLPLSNTQISDAINSISLGEQLIHQFASLQWQYCPVEFQMGMDTINRNQIVPIIHKKLLRKAGNVNGISLWRIEVPGEFMNQDMKQMILGPDLQDVETTMTCELVLKSFSSKRKMEFERQKVRYVALHDNPGIIKYLGSYEESSGLPTGIETLHNILLEPMNEDLESLFSSYPPYLAREVESFWETLNTVVTGLAGLYSSGIYGSLDLAATICPQNIWMTRDKFRISGLDSLLSVDRDNPCRAPETNLRDSPARNKEAIWSLGCIFSLVATWIALSGQGIQQFSRLRRKAIDNLSQYQGPQEIANTDLTLVDSFHDGKDVLPAVAKWHEYLRNSLRHSDTFTGRMLDLVDQRMLVPDTRLRITAAELYEILAHPVPDLGLNPYIFTVNVVPAHGNRYVLPVSAKCTLDTGLSAGNFVSSIFATAILGLSQEDFGALTDDEKRPIFGLNGDSVVLEAAIHLNLFPERSTRVFRNMRFLVTQTPFDLIIGAHSIAAFRLLDPLIGAYSSTEFKLLDPLDSKAGSRPELDIANDDAKLPKAPCTKEPEGKMAQDSLLGSNGPVASQEHERSRYSADLLPKTYFLAPSFDFFPGRSIRLGSIISKPDKPEVSINGDSILAISPDMLHSSHITNWEYTLDPCRDEPGTWTRLLGIMQRNELPGDAQVAKFAIQNLETISFSPDSEFVNRAIMNNEVRQYLTESRFSSKTLYMITGIKLARGDTHIFMSSNVSADLRGHVGAPAGVPVELGPRATKTKQTLTKITSDFVFAYRLMKISLRKSMKDRFSMKSNVQGKWNVEMETVGGRGAFL